MFVVRALFRLGSAVPLVYRLLVFASLASAGVVVFVVWVTSTHIARPAGGGPHWGLASALIAVGLAVTLAINFALMRMVLRPVESLQAAIERVGRGQLSARARRYAIGDTQIDGLIDAFNDMAEALESQRTQLAQLSTRVLAAHEEERRRVARELHDDTGQALTSLLLRLKALERMSDASEFKKGLAELRESASETLEGIRRLARDLRPPVLDDLGLGPALASLANEFSRSFRLQIEQKIPDVGRGLSKEGEVTLYRVAQEALTNVAKHAKAQRVKVTLECERHVARLQIEDDGVGFEPEAALADAGSGLGLLTMKDRVALAGGTLRIRSRPGEGTTVTAELPLRTEEL